VRSLASQSHFEIVDAKCKSKTCSVTVQWTDYGQALSGYASLLHHFYRTSCSQGILLPEPDDRTQPYRATVLYDCAAARGGGS
jgi:hypothetical protein